MSGQLEKKRRAESSRPTGAVPFRRVRRPRRTAYTAEVIE